MNDSTDNTLINIQSLDKQFGPIHAVRNISFSVKKGEVLGFLGPNGAGKSTTMKMITGFLEPTSGTVSVCGFDIQEEPIKAKQKIGYLPEGAPSYGEMTVTSFLNFIAEIRQFTGKQKKDRVEEIIQKINLESVRQQTIDTLSKGFKRRVGVAQSILHDPEVLIMDEPTDGLDPNQKHEVRTLISEMAAKKAIIISTHILEEVDAVCTRAIIIASGQLLFQTRSQGRDADGMDRVGQCDHGERLPVLQRHIPSPAGSGTHRSFGRTLQSSDRVLLGFARDDGSEGHRFRAHLVDWNAVQVQRENDVRLEIHQRDSFPSQGRRQGGR